MRIVHFHPGYRGGGGIAIAVAELAAAQQRAGHDVVIVAAPHRGDVLYGGVDLDRSIEVDLTRSVRVRERRVRVFDRAGLASAIEADVLHVHGLINPDHLNLKLVARPQRVVVSPHSGLSGLGNGRPWSVASKAYVVFEGRLLWRGATFHALTPLERREIEAVYPQVPIYEAPNGIAPPEPVVADRPGSGPLRLLAISRLAVRDKGLDLLVSALAQPGLETVELDLIGPDWRGERSILEAQIDSLGVGGRIRLRGMLPRSELGPYFLAADCFVQPSRREGASTALTEAITRGLPVIASTRNGLATYPELAAQPNVQVPETDVESVAEAIRTVAENHTHLRKAARAHLEDNLEFFSWDRVARAHLEGYVALR